MQLGPIREALAAAARAVVLPAGAGKLTCFGYMPDSVVAPCFYTGEYSLDFDKAFRRALDKAELTCLVLVSKADDATAQRTLDALLSGAGPASLKQALEAARGAPGEAALGGLADDFHITRVQGYRWYEHAGTNYVGAELIIQIIGDGRS